jgi:plasmid stabilization system protein ParE
MKVFFTDKAISEIQNLIRFTEEAFIELFSDSGISAEQVIIQSYLANTSEFKRKLFLNIEQRLKSNKVLGRKQKSSLQELIFHINNRIVIIYFSADLKRKIRIVETVAIGRKPLIF